MASTNNHFTNSTAIDRSRSVVQRCIGFLLFAFCFLLLSCSSDPKFTQYYNHGEQLYLENCSNCHQKNGTGLGRVFPPLDSSDFMDKNFEAVICLMKNGMSGSITVNGKEFNQQMPGINSLTDLEVAQIATYIYNTWSNERGPVEVKQVTPILDHCD